MRTITKEQATNYDNCNWEALSNEEIEAVRNQRQEAYDEITASMEKLGVKLSPTENTLYNSFANRGIMMSDSRFEKFAKAFESYARHLSGREIKKQVNHA